MIKYVPISDVKNVEYTDGYLVLTLCGYLSERLECSTRLNRNEMYLWILDKGTDISMRCVKVRVPIWPQSRVGSLRSDTISILGNITLRIVDMASMIVYDLYTDYRNSKASGSV